MSKQNDYFLNLLYNPEFSPGDFQTVGLNSENTSIEDKNAYKELDIVKNNPLLHTNGEFDEKKFNNLYNKALIGFNQMSSTDSNNKLASSYSAFRDDIFATSANRTNESETFITKMANPNRQTMGFVSNNIFESPKQSVREIAQDKLLWNGSLWVDSPNETPLDNFINPKVMALYDEDVDINGKERGLVGFDDSKIKHRKGEKKINPLTGTYYYETLNGRSIYGRDVLSGWDTLTRDGSAINKYDFFDSDDLEKSHTGSLLKAAVKVAPALIPTIAPWYIGIRVLLGATDLFAKVGKMISGSDSPILSYLEGINAAATQSTSDWSRGSEEMGIQAHAWSIENLLNLSADVFTQLAEQRWMFTHVPSLLKGNKLGFSKEAQEKFKKDYAEKIMLKYKDLGNAESLNPIERALDISNGALWEAQYALELKLNSANKFGEHLSKIYMTGITVADSYGEAKEQGLSDIEAAIFTLGYAAGEYGILSTNLGEHILPELRAEKHKYRNIDRVLSGINRSEAPKDTRKWYKKILDLGKEAAVGDYNDAKIAAAYATNSTTKAVATSVISNALGEGMEEVSEELWYDIAKSLYNGAANLGLTSTGQKLETFDGYNLDQVMNRYALNFVGGLAGGAIAVGLPGFQDGIKKMLGTNMDKKEAYQELVALIRNGKKDDFLRTIDKLHVSDGNLSATDFEIIDGKAEYKQGTSENNRDKAHKTIVHGLVDLIDNLLTINGVKIDDASILSRLTGAKELARFQTLLGGDNVGSATLANYIQDFNSLSTKIADLGIKIDAIKHPRVDLAGKSQQILEENADNLSELESQMAALIKQRDAYISGDMAKIIIPKVLFEMSPVLSYPYIQTNFKDYAEKVEGKVLAEIPETRLKELEESWKNYKSSGFKDDIEYAFLNFMLVTEKFSDYLSNFNLSFLRNPKDFQQEIGNIFSGILEIITNPTNEAEDVQNSAQSFELTNDIALNTTLLKTIIALDSLLTNIGLDNTDLNFIRKIGEEVSLEEILPGDILELKRIANDLRIPFDENNFTDEKVRDIKEEFIRKTIFDILVNHREQVKDVLNNIGYITQANRDFLNENFFNLLLKYDEKGQLLENLYDFDHPDLLEILGQRRSILKEYKDIIDSKPITPIELLVDQFQLAVGDNSLKVSELLKVLQDLMTQKANLGTIEEFGYGADVQEKIKNALSILDAVTSNILGARNDGGKLGAIFGFNSTVNLLNPNMKLAEIEKDEANTLLQDLGKLKTKLLYFQNIFNVNSGLKLEELNKIANRINASFINKVKYIVQALPEDLWNNPDEDGIGVLDKLKSAINKASVAKAINESNEDTRYNLSRELAITLEKESISIQDALYELFNLKDNLAKLENGLLDLDGLLKLIPSTSDVATDYNGTSIDSSLTSFDDRVLISMLATSAAVKSSKFYANYKNTLVSGIAPIPGQELALKMTYAFLVNKPMFQLFGKAYNNLILKEILSADSYLYWTKYGKIVSSEGKLDNSYALLFFNTFLVEGIPGSGKTRGFLAVLYNILKEYLPELLEDVWFIHTDEEKAKEWAQGIGADLDKSKFFSKDTYLKTIYPNYQPTTTNENGIIQMEESQLEIDEETGFPRFKGVDLAKSIKKPTLILIDESTRFSQLEMFVSEAFQEENDISAIATGDYDQIGAIGLVLQSDGNKLFLNTSQDNFFHSPKLGTSMRTENTIKDLNIAIIRKNKLDTILKLASGELTSPLFNLSFYQDESGLYGERIIDKADPDLDSTITLMLSSLKGEKDENGVWVGEKLTVIYLDKNSEIYKKLLNIALNNEEHKGKINFTESSAAQGDEGQYYIVDLNIVDIGRENTDNLGNHANFVNTFYTAISRSSQGTLIIKNFNVAQVAETSRIQELVKSPLSKEAIDKFSRNRIAALAEIITEEAGHIDINRRNKPNVIDDSGSEGEDTSEEEAATLNTKKVQINNDTPDEYNMLIHSMPSLDTGFITDSDGNYVPSVGSEERIDGLNGIVKIAETKITDGKKVVNLSKFSRSLGLDSDGKLKNQKQALETLNAIAQAGLYCSDVDEIKNIIKTQLGLNLDEDLFGVDFLFMIRDTLDDPKHVEEKRKKGFLKLLKSKTEKLFGIFNKAPEEVKSAIQNKLFALNVYRVVDDKRVNILTVPLAIFTNPSTMLEANGFESLKEEYDKLPEQNRDLRMLQLLKDDSFVNGLDTAGKTNAKKLLKHLQIYTYKSKDGDLVVYLDKPLAAIAKGITGPTITVNSKGTSYRYTDRLIYDGEYVDLSSIDQTVHHLTRKIYFTPKDIIVNGKTIVKKGHGFVLASDFYNTLNDDELLQLFVDKELNDNPEGRISVIYVSSPKISIVDYFKNFALKFKGVKNEDDPTIDTNIGNEKSEFRISEYITKNDSPFDTYIKDLVTSNPGNKTNTLVRWDIFKSVILQLSTDFESLSTEEQIKLLRQPIGKTRYINLIKYDGPDDSLQNHINSLQGVYRSKNVTLKNFISNNLLVFALKLKDGFISEKLSWTNTGNVNITKSIQDNLDKIKESLPDEFLTGIYTLIKGNKSDSIGIGSYEFIPSDAENYETTLSDGTTGKFRINGKIDSTMLVMDVFPVIDDILKVINNPTEKKTQVGWNIGNNRKHIPENPVTATSVIPQVIIDSVPNSGLLQTLVLGNVKNFENVVDISTLREALNKISYTLYSDSENAKYTVVKLKAEQHQTDVWNVILDNNLNYWEIDDLGNLYKPTIDTILKRVSQAEFLQIENLAKLDDTSTLTPIQKVYVGIYKLIQAQNKGDLDILSLEDLLNSVDILDPNVMKAMYPDIDGFKGIIDDYVNNYEKEYKKEYPNVIDFLIVNEVKLPLIPSPEVDALIQNIDKLARNYETKNNC